MSLLLLLWLLEGAQSYSLLTSSATSGFVCKGDRLSFNCRGNASGLTWTYNSESQLFPDTNAVRVFSDSSVYSVLLESGNNVIVSDLLFLNVSDAPSVFVECTVGGLTNVSNISVIDGAIAPLIMNHTITGRFVTLLLDHKQLEQIERFDVMLDGNLHGTIHSSQRQAFIILPECRTYRIHIVAVDICSNSNSSDDILVCCLPSPRTDPTTDSNTTESILTVTGTPSLGNRCISVINEVWGVSSASLALDVIITIIVLITTVMICYKKCYKKSETEKIKNETEISEIEKNKFKSLEVMLQTILDCVLKLNKEICVQGTQVQTSSHTENQNTQPVDDSNVQSPDMTKL